MADRPARLTGIRRPSRLGAVWRSYRTRWLLWALVAGAGFIFVSFAWFIWTEPPNFMTSAVPSAPQPSPAVWLSPQDDGRQVDWTKLRSLNIITELDHCEPLWTPGAIPRLESLTIFDNISDDQLAELCKLYDLKSLTLYNLEAVTADGLRPLRNETSLEYLQIISLHGLHDAPSLDWPPNLRTLVCDDESGISLLRLNEWRKLPRLTCLSTRLVLLEHRRPAEMLDSLRGFPSLTRLFVLELPPDFPDVASVQRALPNLRVRPNSFDPVRGQRAATILIGRLLVIVLLSIQLSSQFVTPASMLTPHFTRSHVSPVVGGSVALFLMSLSLYLLAGCSILVAMGMCGASVFLLASATRLLRLMTGMNGYQMPGFNNFGVVISLTVFPVLGIQLVSTLFGAELDWFLRGQYPWLTLMLLAGSLWGAFDLVAWQIGLQHDLEESGCGNVPLSMFDIGGWTEWSRSVVAARTGEGKKPAFAYRRFDSRIERFIEQMQQRKSTTSVALWRLGGAGSMLGEWLKATVVFLVVCLIVIGVPVAWLAPEWWSQFGSATTAPVVFQLLGGGLIMPLAFAWQRRPMQEMELLRPASRRDWASTWFRGVASEIAPVLLVAIAFCAALQWTGQLGSWSMMHVTLAAVLAIGIMGIIFAVGMWMFTLTSLWQIALVACIAWIAVVLCIVIPILLQSHLHEWQSPAILIPTIAGLYSVTLAWRRWQNWEVGQVT
ncbi:MAG: hypothetical protein AABP62_11940 [Planctomycetota bacterium]